MSGSGVQVFAHYNPATGYIVQISQRVSGTEIAREGCALIAVPENLWGLPIDETHIVQNGAIIARGGA